MTQDELLITLIKIHSKYSSDRRSDRFSQFCTMWPMDDPPDTLMTTYPLDDICEVLNIGIEEDYAALLFDMTLEEAAKSLFVFMQSD